MQSFEQQPREVPEPSREQGQRQVKLVALLVAIGFFGVGIASFFIGRVSVVKASESDKQPYKPPDPPLATARSHFCDYGVSELLDGSDWTSNHIAYLLDYEQEAEGRRVFRSLQSSFSNVITSNGQNGSKMDGKSLKSQGILIRDDFPSKEKGCYFGHQNIWTDFLMRSRCSPGKWATVFELDAMGNWNSNFQDQLKILQTAVDNNQFPDIDVIYIGHCFDSMNCPPHNDTPAIELGSGINLYPSKWPICTHGYMISSRGAQYLLDRSVPMTLAVDIYMRKFIQFDEEKMFKALTACPMLTWQPWINPETGCPNGKGSPAGPIECWDGEAWKKWNEQQQKERRLGRQVWKEDWNHF